MSDFNAKVIAEFRANSGVVGGPFEGASMILVTHTGARSGARRTQPLVRVDIDDDRYVIASAAGADKHPAWFHNIVANPQITVEVGDETYEATASVVDRETRDRVYAAAVERMAGFGDYEKKTDRVIPVVSLTRR